MFSKSKVMEENTIQNPDNAQLQTAYNAGYAKGKQDSIIELLRDEKFNNFILNIIHSAKENKITDSIRYIKEYLIDILLVLIILGAIIFSSSKGFIDTCTSGTLIGAVIGYALARFKNN